MSDGVILLKTRRVVDLVEVLANDAGEINGTATYASLDDDGDISDKYESCCYTTIDYKTYVELGSPQKITVSIEPGNVLQRECEEEQAPLAAEVSV